MSNTRQTLKEILAADEDRLQQFIARHLPLLRELGESWQRFQQEAAPASTESAAASEFDFFDSEDVPPPVSAESPAISDEEKSQAPREASAATYNPLDWPGTETPPQPAADTNAADNAAAAAPMTDGTSSAPPPPPASTLHKLDDELQIDLTKSALKPEPAMPIPPHTPTPAPQPQPRITLSPLPPANEGQPYERKLPSDSPVLNIAFGQDCGLAWDADARRIHGTPTISGDVQLTITIEHDGKPHDIIQPLHINPDPKSLWQDNPSDQSAPFAKPDSAETLQDTPRGRLLAARVRGRSHAHVGSYCDDDYRINWHEASGIHLLIVSDGAGSASHARLGSQLAVNTTADTILNLLNEADKGYHRLAQLNNEQRAQISEFLIARALHAAHSAHRAAAQETGIAEKALSCTLLIALTLPLAGGGWYSAGYQVGDGAAALWLPEGDKLHLLGTADSGAYSGETQFLAAAQLQPEDYRRRIRSVETASAPHVILMTDGVSDAKFETDAALADAQHWRTFWQDGELQAALAADDPKAALHEWLGFWSRGNHDDRTIAFFLPAAGETQT